MEDLLYTGAAIVALILPFFNIAVWWILRSALQGHYSVALEERKNVSAILAIASLLLALLGLNRVTTLFFGIGIVNSPITLIVLTSVVVLISLPSLLFLKKYLSGDFDGS